MPVDCANEGYSSVRLGAAASVVNFIVALAFHHVFTNIYRIADYFRRGIFFLFRPKPEVVKFYRAKNLYLEVHVSLNALSFLQRETVSHHLKNNK